MWADLGDTTRVSALLNLSRALVRRSEPAPDLIVWPETAIPPNPSTSLYTDQIQTFVDSMDTPILAGAITTGSADGTAYRNSALLVVPRGAVRTYDKISLVPFAERVPFAGVFRHLERLAIPAGGVQGYEPGRNRAIFEISNYRFGVLICFETLFSSAARAYARDGVHAFVAITQDGWWGNSFGYRQHLAFNRLRSIETGRPMLQVAVTGVSALIHSDGQIRELAGWMEPAAWVVDMPPAAPITPYVRWGDWVTVIAAMMALVLAAACFVPVSGMRERRDRRM
jgi:apolipoprotein N-acyltransferase